jgi:hypothetical protein
MFEKFISGYLDSVKDAAKHSDHVVQRHNIPIFEEILTYCKANNLMVSNICSMIKGVERTKFGGDPMNEYNSDILKEYSMNENPMTKFVVYGAFIFKHANNLANQLVLKHTPFVELFTTLKNKLFNMKIGGESNIVVFIDIRSDFISMAPAIAGKWLPPNIELMNIYHQLYSPQFYGDHSDLIKYEAKCWPIFKKMHIPLRPNNSKRSFPYNALLMTWLKNRDDCILIGPMATTHTSRNNYKVQILTTMPQGMISDKIKLLMKRLGKLTSVESRTYIDENIPGEYRFTKTIITNKKDHLVEIFNTPLYELVPYIVVDDIQVGLPNVLLYHMMLDIWFIGTLRASGKLPASAATQIIGNYIAIMEHVRGKKISVPTPTFMGIYKDDNLVKKKLSLANKFRPYYPAQYKEINNKFREI